MLPVIRWPSALGAELMVRVRVRVRVAACVVEHLQCLDAIYSEPVRGSGHTREECHWSHAWQRFKRRNKGVNPNGILERKFLPENGHRTTKSKQPATTGAGSTPNARQSPLWICGEGLFCSAALQCSDAIYSVNW
jgi:hypothetical protein